MSGARGLQISVVIGTILVVASTWMGDRDLDGYLTEKSQGQQDVERNERSTPRSFILPATPGVAFEQERQKLDKIREFQIAKCAAMLRTHGFRVNDEGTLLNAKLVEAIYTFQVAHNLAASGQLDEPTMRELKCL